MLQEPSLDLEAKDRVGVMVSGRYSQDDQFWCLIVGIISSSCRFLLAALPCPLG